MEPTAKRARADTLGDEIPMDGSMPQHSTEGLKDMLAAMSNATHLSLIIEAATRHSDIMATVKAQYERQLAHEAASKKAWHELNTKYSSMSGSKQYDVAFDVAKRIGEMLKDIAQNTIGHSSFGTKLSAMETIREIYKSTLLASDTLGHYVYQNLWNWGEMLVLVAEAFSGDELDRLLETVTGDNALWLDKFEEVAGLARGMCIADELKTEEVSAILRDENDEEEDEEADDDEEEGQDDEEQ